MDADVPTVSRVTARRIRYAVFTMALLLLAFYGQMLPVLRTRLMEYLGIAQAHFGLMFSIGTLTSAISLLTSGMLIDRHGPRVVMRLGFAGVAAAFVVIAVAGNHFVVFACGVALARFCLQPLFIGVSAYLMDLFPRHRRRLLALNLVSQGTSGFLYPAWAEFLLWVSVAVPGVSFAMALHIPFAVLAGALLVGGTLYRRRRQQRGGRDAARWRWRDMLLPRWAFPLIFLAVMHGVGDSALHSWMAYFLERGGFDARPIAPGLILSAYAVGYIAARLGLAVLPERFGRRLFLVLPGLLGGAAMVMGLLSRSYMLTSAGYVLGAFLWSVEYPAAMAALADALPRRFGAVLAGQGVLACLGCAGGVYGVGWLTERYGDAAMWKVMLLPVACFPICSVLGLIWILWGRRRAEAAVSSPEAPSSPA